MIRISEVIIVDFEVESVRVIKVRRVFIGGIILLLKIFRILILYRYKEKNIRFLILRFFF